MAETWIPAIDISVHQGEFIVRTAKDAGISTFWTRALFGCRIDEHLAQNVSRFKHNGCEFGLYGWFRPDVDPISQANLLYKLTKDHGATLIPMVDVEDHGDMKPLAVRKALRKYVNCLTKQLGKPPAIYSSSTFWDRHVKDDTFGNCPFWAARYVHSLIKQPDGTWKNGYLAHPVPVIPAMWSAYALSHNKPILPKGWTQWTAWQFSAGHNRCGKRYGAQSTDLDLNIIRKSEISRLRLP